MKNKLGRNDPCHCGSLKKYKKCCFKKDFNKTLSSRVIERITHQPIPGISRIVNGFSSIMSSLKKIDKSVEDIEKENENNKQPNDEQSS